MTSLFAELGLAAPLARAVDAAGYVTPTPIQAQAIPPLLQGRDLLGLAQTGTGKTAAFVLPILQALRSLGTRAEPKTARALILAPTRELAIQIHETVRSLSKGQHFAHAAVYGGVSINPQIAALARGVDILVATPGRLVDLIKQKCVTLSATRWFVLDEADRMLDMGFIRDVKRILPLLPKERQSMLFSATMPQAIDEIAGGLLRDPARVEVRTEVVPLDRIAQHLAYVPQNAKREALLHILTTPDVTRAIVFARTKHGANRLHAYLESHGCKVDVIHGNKSQGARQRALAGFKTGELTILVATDIAARGIDVADVSHVINADLPDEPEAYVHRIGRTARAGREGVAITLCDSSERDKLRSVERLIKRAIPVMTIAGLDLKKAAAASATAHGDRGRDERSPRRDDRGNRGGRRDGRSFGGGRSDRAGESSRGHGRREHGAEQSRHADARPPRSHNNDARPNASKPNRASAPARWRDQDFRTGGGAPTRGGR